MENCNFINNELFEAALSDYFKEKVEVVGFKGSTAVMKGDNYTSDTFKISVAFRRTIKGTKNENLAVILKCADEEGSVRGELAKDLKLFEKESGTFKHTLPRLAKALGCKLWPTYISSTLSKRSVLILEDLTPLGYKMSQRHVGFDLNHCLLALKTISKFHAASLVVHTYEPKLIGNYHEGLFSEKQKITDWIKQGFEAMIKATLKWPGFEIYARKLQLLGPDEWIKRGLNAIRGSNFNVLNHGDLWVNNMLFNYDHDGKLLNMKLVDFQMCVYASPVIDLHYLLATSPELSVRERHLSYLLNYYYAQLLKNLADLQYNLEEVPDRKEFRKEFNNRAFYGVLTAATVLPLVKATGRNDASFEDLMNNDGDDGFRYDCYNNDRYRKYMEHMFPYFDKLGLLD